MPLYKCFCICRLKCFCIYTDTGLNDFVYAGLNAFIYTGLNALVWSALKVSEQFGTIKPKCSTGWDWDISDQLDC